jgi:hypothetical protein
MTWAPTLNCASVKSPSPTTLNSAWFQTEAISSPPSQQGAELSVLLTAQESSPYSSATSSLPPLYALPARITSPRFVTGISTGTGRTWLFFQQFICAPLSAVFQPFGQVPTQLNSQYCL